MTDENMQAAVDAALLQTLPVALCPPSGGPPPFASNDSACRLVVANDGVWLQARSAAINAALKVLDHGPYLLPSTPFGTFAPAGEDFMVEHTVQPNFDWFGTFLQHARSHWPNECAGFVVYDARFDAWRLVMTDNSSASAGHVRYHAPKLYTDEIVVIDLHSHGAGHAFFSPVDDTDDRNDAGSLKLAFVVGRVHTEEVEVASRLVAFGCIGPTSKAVREAPADASYGCALA